MQSGNRIYGGLHYANVSPTYVGQPTEELDKLGQKLEEDYNTNKDNADKLQIAVANMQVRNHNNPILQDAIRGIQGTLDEHINKGNWEYAGNNVSKAAKDFAVNPLVKLAMQDKQLYDAWNKDLEGNNKILEEDKQYARHKANLENNKKVEIDPVTGQAKNLFNGTTPPEYVDINKKISEVVKDLNPTTRQMLLQQAEKSGYLKSGSIEELTPDVLRKAAKDLILGSPEAKAYINFQTEKQDYMSRLTKDANGNVTLRPYQTMDLITNGIIDNKGNAYIHSKNDKNEDLYIDKNGKVYDPSKDNIGINKQTGIPYLLDKNGKMIKPLDFKEEINNELLTGIKDANGNIVVPGLYNADGTLNQQVAENQIKERLTAKQLQKHLDFASDYSYSKEDVNYIEDADAKAARDWMYKKKELNYAHDLANENNDFYVNSVMKLQNNGAPATLDPAAAKGLFVDGKAPLRNAILEFAKTSPLHGITPEQQRLIPVAKKIIELQEKLKEKNRIDEIGNRIKNKQPTTFKERADYQTYGVHGGDNFSVFKDDPRATTIEQEIKDLEASTGTSREQMAEFYNKYSKLKEPEKEAVQTLGKIMNLPSAPVSLLGKDNLRKVNGSIQVGVNAQLDRTQLNITDEEIQNLNKLFDSPILQQSTTKTINEEGKAAKNTNYEVKLYLEHTPTKETQQRYNSVYGVNKYTSANDNLFNQVTTENTIKNQLGTNPWGFYNDAFVTKEEKDKFDKTTVKIDGQNQDLNTLYTRQADIITNPNSSDAAKQKATDAIYVLVNYYSSLAK